MHCNAFRTKKRSLRCIFPDNRQSTAIIFQSWNYMCTWFVFNASRKMWTPLLALSCLSLYVVQKKFIWAWLTTPLFVYLYDLTHNRYSWEKKFPATNSVTLLRLVWNPKCIQPITWTGFVIHKSFFWRDCGWIPHNQSRRIKDIYNWVCGVLLMLFEQFLEFRSDFRWAQ